MIRRPPRSTLFPYTNALPIFPPQLDVTESRDRPPGISAAFANLARTVLVVSVLRHGALWFRGSLRNDSRRRSEEHTSELQSPCNLVCRLLLEKKKKQM